MIKFKTYRHMDKQVFGCEAFSMLVPERWTVSGGLLWRQHATMPGAIALSVRSPDGLFELNLLPSMPYFWDSFSVFGTPEGTIYMGNEIRRPPAGFADYLQRFILPRGGFQTKIVKTKPFPELVTALHAENPSVFGCKILVDGGLAELEYFYNGHYFEGEMSCGIVITNMMYSKTSWIADKMMSTRMPKGYTGEYSQVFSAMLGSFRFDLVWFHRYHQFVQALTGYVLQDIYNAGFISRIIANTSSQISQMVRQSYEHQQATYSAVYQKVSERIRGVNAYYDPYKGYTVELPGGYRYAYTNPLGEYIVTDDPNFNPNYGSNLNWTILK